MKKFIGIICISIISFAMTACANQETSATNNSSSITTIETTAKSTATEEVAGPTDATSTTEIIEPETSITVPTDVESYIDGNYFNLFGYLNANSLPFFYVAPVTEQEPASIVITTRANFTIQISTNPDLSNDYVIYERESMPSMGYTHTTKAEANELFTTNYDKFYLYPEDLKILVFLARNVDNMESGSCPFAGGNIPHYFNNNCSPIECND